jgi:FlaA1/EpsC-like NDP-sugar epimerase
LKFSFWNWSFQRIFAWSFLFWRTSSLLLLVRRRKKKDFIASFAGKHVLITGGSKGIGLSISRKLLQEGAFVTLVSRSGSNLEEAKTSLVKELHCGSDQILTKVRKTNISLPPPPFKAT